MSRNLPKVLFIAGTTAVGKTDLSTRLAELINGEIISADSVQVYRYMDIGSAKVDLPTRQLIRHHLLDVVGIQESFSIGDYHKLALEAIQDVISRGKVPIVVGGTSFYFQFLMSGLTESPPSTDASRDMIESLLAEDEGDWDKSLSRLEAIDPHYARTLGTNDWYRLKRALDICHQSGRSLTIV
jgi:tRNA dimethylallyltransferase